MKKIENIDDLGKDGEYYIYTNHKDNIEIRWYDESISKIVIKNGFIAEYKFWWKTAKESSYTAETSGLIKKLYKKRFLTNNSYIMDDEEAFLMLL